MTPPTEALFRKTITQEGVTRTVKVFKDYVFITVPKKHNIVIDSPERSETPDYDTSIYIGDHVTILIGGKAKDKITLLLQSDEFPTKVVIDDCEGTFEVVEKQKDEESEVR